MKWVEIIRRHDVLSITFEKYVNILTGTFDTTKSQ